MAIPGYLWITDDQGHEIKSTVTVKDREGCIEVLGFEHEVYLPTDNDTGALMANRKHGALKIIKQFCSASPILYKACCDGKTLQSMRLSWYRINDTGSEEEYFRHTLDHVKVVGIRPQVHDVKAKEKEKYGHLESVEFRYQTIKWEYLDGNIATQDTWTDRT